MISVLLVEDNPTDVLLTEEALADSHFHIDSVERLDKALTLLASRRFDVVLLDLGLPDSQGLETLRALRVGNSHVAIVVLTGKDDEVLALQALQEGAQDYLAKGDIEAKSLRKTLRYAVERSNAERLLRQSENRLQELTAHIHQVLWVIDARESKILYVSPGYEEMWGRTCQSLIENPYSYMDGIHPLDMEMMVRENTTMLKTGYIDVETRILRPDQTVRWVWIRGYPVTEKGQVV
jgi:PAS domain S-box-containing protein